MTCNVFGGTLNLALSIYLLVTGSLRRRVVMPCCRVVVAGDILSSAPYGWFILLSFGIFVLADVLASRR